MQVNKIAILGAGISGLSFGYYLKKYHPQIDFEIFEKDSRVGGVIDSEKKEDYVIEWGPRGIRPKGSGQVLLELVEDLGLWNELVFADNKAKKRYIYHDGSLQSLPHSIFSFLTSPYLKLFLKAISKDLKAKEKTEDETIADFVDRHFGKEFRELFFDSLVSGIWAGDIEKMSLSAAFPLLKKLESGNGSIIKSLLTYRATPLESKVYSKSVTSKALFSFRGGIQVLIDALRDQLRDHINFGAQIESIDFNSKPSIAIDGKTNKFDHLISTIPAYALAKYVPNKLSSKLNNIKYSSVGVLNFKTLKANFDFDGFGFLVPSKEDSVVLGMVANSNTFPEQFESKFAINTVMLGGARYTPDKLKSLDLIGESKCFLERVFGENFFMEIESQRIIDKAIPQFNIGHLDLVSQIEELAPRNLTILGNYMYGVSLVDIVLKSKQSCKELIG